MSMTFALKAKPRAPATRSASSTTRNGVTTRFLSGDDRLWWLEGCRGTKVLTSPVATSFLFSAANTGGVIKLNGPLSGDDGGPLSAAGVTGTAGRIGPAGGI